MKTILERTAIALQEAAEFRSACSRTGYEMLLDGTNYTEPQGPQWLAADQDEGAGLYELARRIHADVLADDYTRHQ